MCAVFVEGQNPTFFLRQHIVRQRIPWRPDLAELAVGCRLRSLLILPLNNSLGSIRHIGGFGLSRGSEIR